MIHFFPSRPIALDVLGFGIHWYGLLYLLAFLIGWMLLPHLLKTRGLTLSSDDRSNFFTAVILGVLVGGRLGFVFFYEPQYFLQHPLDIFAVWKGGMSSHGGFIGVLLALFLFCRSHRIDWRALGDVIIVPVAIGLALGRIGNFINQEVYGTATTLPWGIAIPGVEGLRHPTQIYAFFKDIFITGVCYLHLTRVKPIRPGSTGALFLMLYGVLRFLVEFVREQDYPPFVLGSLSLTRGQLLTLPIFAAGVLVWWLSRKTHA